ncbi:MAG: LytTR family DNA-binding domain-containing protein [Bacteroidota bacterium]
MIKAILIDDEKRAQRVLKALLQEACPQVEVVAVCDDVPEGVRAISKYQPQVVFCDVEMPNYSGLELLSFFREITFEIIFVTAYRDFAVDAFALSAVDYILKPVQIDKLTRAVEKLEKRINHERVAERFDVLKENLQHREFRKIGLPVSDGLIFVLTENIRMVEADGAYSRVKMKDEKEYVISKTLKYFDRILNSSDRFFRIHRSFIINVEEVVKYSKAESYVELENGATVRISRDRKVAYEAFITEYRV